LLNIKGTPDSAGFGLIGLVGPIKSLNLLDMGTTSGLLIIAITYIIVPLLSALFFHYLFTKVLKLYDPNIFKYKV
ncbi:PTS sugar transporter subunit IIC, partial [Staphylococcus haemolyticus]|uniref:PTS sugar transporter subunit IIC n=1 Tax=Staphylococcus haemolyticus TaxID=1283 RepID=UPI0015D697D1